MNRMASGRIYWAVCLVTLAVYGAMVGWSLPKLSQLAGGVAMFDMRPGGYTPDEARTIIAALGQTGRSFYLTVQHRLDTIFPALMALFLGLTFFRLFSRRWASLFLAIAVVGALFDYLENAAVAAMLEAGPTGFDAQTAQWASLFTVAKSGFVTVAMGALLVGLVRSVWRWLARQTHFARGNRR